MVKAVRLVFNTTLTFFTSLVVFYVFFYFVKFWISLQGKKAAKRLKGSTLFFLLKLVPSILIALYVLFLGAMIYYTLKGRKKVKGRVF